MRRVKAKAFGTTALADGSIVHFDPTREKVKENARYFGGVFSEADAKRLVDHGMGEDVGAADDDDTPFLAVVLPNNDAAAERLAEASAEDEEHPQTSSLSTAATVAFPNNPLNATTGPAGDGISDGDPDAPPPARGAAKRAGSGRKVASPKRVARKATGAKIDTSQAPAPGAAPGTNNEPAKSSPTGSPEASN